MGRWRTAVKLFGLVVLGAALVSYALAAFMLYRSGTYSENVVQNDANQAIKYYDQSARIQARHDCPDLRGTGKEYCVDRAERSAKAEQRQELQVKAERASAIWDAVVGKATALGLVLTALGLWVTALVLFLTPEQRNDLSIDGGRNSARGRKRDSSAKPKRGEDGRVGR